MLETCEQFQSIRPRVFLSLLFGLLLRTSHTRLPRAFVSIRFNFKLLFELLLRISHTRMPKVLIEKRDVFLDGWWKIFVVAHLGVHPLFVEVVDFIQDDVDPFLKIALGFIVEAIKFAIELNHGILSFGIGSLFAVGH